MINIKAHLAGVPLVHGREQVQWPLVFEGEVKDLEQQQVVVAQRALASVAAHVGRQREKQVHDALAEEALQQLLLRIDWEDIWLGNLVKYLEPRHVDESRQ